MPRPVVLVQVHDEELIIPEPAEGVRVSHLGFLRESPLIRTRLLDNIKTIGVGICGIVGLVPSAVLGGGCGFFVLFFRQSRIF
jgi:hypothetical protein